MLPCSLGDLITPPPRQQKKLYGLCRQLVFIPVRANGDDVLGQTMVMTGIGRAVHVDGNGGADTIFGTEFNEIIEGGAGADTLSGGNGRDAFLLETGDNTTVNFDQITDFTLVSARWTVTEANNSVAEFQATAVGGTGTDILDIGIAVTVATGGAVVNGVLQGVNAAGTLADAVALASGATAANVDGEAVAFEFGGNSYVFVRNANDDLLVQLSAVSGIAGVSLVSSALTTEIGGANWLVIG